MCYSDLSALYGAREINVDKWPYASADNSIEYPVITGLVTWSTGLLINDVDGYRAYFDLNAFLIALLFIAATGLLWLIRPEFAYLLPVTPAVVASLFINWDLWAVIGSLAAIYLFKIKRYRASASILGIAIATKFFPITLLLPVTLHFLKRRNHKILASYLFITLATWLLINLPVALNNWQGWARFYEMNFNRNNDLGSIWYALNLIGIDIRLGVSATLALLILGIALIYLAYSKMKDLDRFESFATTAFLSVALFVSISKVYSPQYVLWLTPLALIAMRSRDQRSAFWIWQGGEALYHLAIWQYLASYSGAKFGLPENLYSLTILIRLLTLAWFCRALLVERDARKPYPQPVARIS